MEITGSEAKSTAPKSHRGIRTQKINEAHPEIWAKYTQGALAKRNYNTTKAKLHLFYYFLKRREKKGKVIPKISFGVKVGAIKYLRRFVGKIWFPEIETDQYIHIRKYIDDNHNLWVCCLKTKIQKDKKSREKNSSRSEKRMILRLKNKIERIKVNHAKEIIELKREIRELKRAKPKGVHLFYKNASDGIAVSMMSALNSKFQELPKSTTKDEIVQYCEMILSDSIFCREFEESLQSNLNHPISTQLRSIAKNIAYKYSHGYTGSHIDLH